MGMYMIFIGPIVATPSTELEFREGILCPLPFLEEILTAV